MRRLQSFLSSEPVRWNREATIFHHLEKVCDGGERVAETDDRDGVDDPGVAEIQGQPRELVGRQGPEVAALGLEVHHPGDPLIHDQAGRILVDPVKTGVHAGAVGLHH